VVADATGDARTNNLTVNAAIGTVDGIGSQTIYNNYGALAFTRMATIGNPSLGPMCQESSGITPIMLSLALGDSGRHDRIRRLPGNRAQHRHGYRDPLAGGESTGLLAWRAASA